MTTQNKVKTYTPEQLKRILAAHKKWVETRWNQEVKGKRANLRSANLRSANLSGADLSGAYLRSANLRSANLRSADLRSANLSGADLSGADLRSANLSGANLRSADLSGADLSGADLRSADLEKAVLPTFALVPEEGAFIAWKKVHGAVLKLEIPADAKRVSSLIGRKCRASRATVLEAFPQDATQTEFRSRHDRYFIYRVGDTVEPSNGFSDDIREECQPGIHFFITRAEAEAY